MATYTTKSGDMWDGIASRELGGAEHTAKLMEMNMEHRDIYIFPAGVVLELPVIERKMASTMPPWKQ